MGLFAMPTDGDHMKNVKAAIFNLDTYLRSLETGKPSTYLLRMAEDCVREARRTVAQGEATMKELHRLGQEYDNHK